MEHPDQMTAWRTAETLCDLVNLAFGSGQADRVGCAFHISKVPCSSNVLRIHDLISISVKQFVGNVGTKYFILLFHGS